MGEAHLVGPDAFVEAQDAAGAQHAVDFGQRPRWIGNCAEHEAHLHRVEGTVREREAYGITVNNLDRTLAPTAAFGARARMSGSGSSATRRVARRWSERFLPVPAPISRTSPSASATSQ